jgi:predicted membrane protein
MESTSLLVWGMLFGSIGLGFFIYGKRQRAIVPLVTGITLFIFPYFISDATLLIIIGAILIVVPYFVRI